MATAACGRACALVIRASSIAKRCAGCCASRAGSSGNAQQPPNRACSARFVRHAAECTLGAPTRRIVLVARMAGATWWRSLTATIGKLLGGNSPCGGGRMRGTRTGHGVFGTVRHPAATGRGVHHPERNGLIFHSRRLGEASRLYRLPQACMTPYTPEQHGVIERWFRSLKEACVWHHHIWSFATARTAIGQWIVWSSRGTPQHALGSWSPRQDQQQRRHAAAWPGEASGSIGRGNGVVPCAREGMFSSMDWSAADRDRLSANDTITHPHAYTRWFEDAHGQDAGTSGLRQCRGSRVHPGVDRPRGHPRQLRSPALSH